MDSLDTAEATGTHFNDWPNTAGFDVHYEERTPIELTVQGTIPAYAAGVLFRTGLGPRSVESESEILYTVNHWFDEFAQVHRFQLHLPQSGETRITRVTYNSRLTSDGLIRKIRQTGSFDGFTFAARYDPCTSLFKKVQSTFYAALDAVWRPQPKPDEVNNSVTISVNWPGLSRTGEAQHYAHPADQIATLANKTDAARMQMLDPDTLEPIGLVQHSVLHPELSGPVTAAHAKSDPQSGDVYNYNLDFKGPASQYKLFKVSSQTGKTSILATFKHYPCYIHSLFLTERYVILCAWNSCYKSGGLSVLWNKNILDSLYFEDKAPARWYVVDKRCPENESGNGLIGIYESDPFVAFHAINAFEQRNETGGVDVVADVPIYESMDIFSHAFMDNLLSNSPVAKNSARKALTTNNRPILRRYRLPNLPGAICQATPQTTTIDFSASYANTMELPVVNWNVLCRPYRYIYGVTGENKSSTFVDGILKYDLHNHQVQRWEKRGHTPGEPIFVPNPVTSLDSTAEIVDGDAKGARGGEDDGVLLTVVLDGYKGRSYLLVLDARDLTEVGRADVPGPVGFGFHGAHTRLGTGNGGHEVHY